MSGLIKPTLHLNGTSADHLDDAYEQAMHKVGVAIEVVGETAPNARDYYPQGDLAFREAVKQHTARLMKLQEVRDELAQILEDLRDQQAQRKR